MYLTSLVDADTKHVPLLGERRTFLIRLFMSANDPKRTCLHKIWLCCKRASALSASRRYLC